MISDYHRICGIVIRELVSRGTQIDLDTNIFIEMDRVVPSCGTSILIITPDLVEEILNEISQEQSSRRRRRRPVRR